MRESVPTSRETVVRARDAGEEARGRPLCGGARRGGELRHASAQSHSEAMDSLGPMKLAAFSAGMGRRAGWGGVRASRPVRERDSSPACRATVGAPWAAEPAAIGAPPRQRALRRSPPSSGGGARKHAASPVAEEPAAEAVRRLVRELAALMAQGAVARLLVHVVGLRHHLRPLLGARRRVWQRTWSRRDACAAAISHQIGRPVQHQVEGGPPPRRRPRRRRRRRRKAEGRGRPEAARARSAGCGGCGGRRGVRAAARHRSLAAFCDAVLQAVVSMASESARPSPSCPQGCPRRTRRRTHVGARRRRSTRRPTPWRREGARSIRE